MLVKYVDDRFTNIHVFRQHTFSPLSFTNIGTAKNQSLFEPTHFWLKIFRKWWTRVILLNRFWYSEWIGTTLPDIFFVSKPSRLNWIELLFNTVWKRWNFRKTWPQKKRKLEQIEFLRKKFVGDRKWVIKIQICHQFFWWHRYWWQMWVTQCVDDKFKMFVTKIEILTPTSRACHQL